METLVVAHYRNQYHGKVKAYRPARHGSPSEHFRQINCRTFHSGAGILPTPYSPDCTSPVKKSSPKTPSPATKAQFLRSSPISIDIPAKVTDFDYELCFSSENSLLSELWAGPAYSNSPPPSSLPIPKFSAKPKRTVSLDLPVSDNGIKMHPIAKSAPASPTREHNSATLTLRRILNLDLGDEEL